jgi:hypothetical protein
MDDGGAGPGEDVLGQLPAPVSRALAHQVRAVRPILPAAARSLAVGLTALALSVAVVVFRGLRPDAADLGPGRLWVPALLRAAAGIWLIHVALRSALPGGGPSRRAQIAAALATPVLLAVLAEWLSPAVAPRVSFAAWLQVATGCYRTEMIMALPAAILFGWLLARAYPVRPALTAALGAAGAALIADAAMHLTCPVREWSHALLAHGAAVATVSLAAAALGLLTLRRRFPAR